jgi:hypothetical protein
MTGKQMKRKRKRQKKGATNTNKQKTSTHIELTHRRGSTQSIHST